MSAPLHNRLAMVLFSIYLLLYGGFIVINLFMPDLMEKTPYAGVNLAIWYGFGLIFTAIILAFIYGFSFTSTSKQASGDDSASSQEVSK
ncbi:MAG: DUF485 domain-containing protein [Planctomycetaceae bacterium]|nr:DUF485 domain-containing protein [Planctomycetaceae bacterium]